IENSNKEHLLLSISYDYILQIDHDNSYNQFEYIRLNYKFKVNDVCRDDSFTVSVDFDELIIEWDLYRCQPLS
ncbi:unnamed protein product, partial [Rotaria sp. Silwood1]